MPRYATLIFSNPLREGLPAVRAKALVVRDEFALVMPPKMAELLQLEAAGTRPVMETGANGATAMPYLGPVLVNADACQVFTGAIACGNEVVVGCLLAAELGLFEEDSATASARSGREFSSVPVSTPATALQSDLAATADPKILQVEDFADAATCKAICDYARQQKPAQAGVVDHSKSTAKKVETFVDTKSRDTLRIPIDGISGIVRDLFFAIYSQHIEPFYNLRIEWWEKPQLLCYTKGGKYGAHADADHWVKKQDGGAWKRSQDRDISVILYLNDEFTGGRLDFPNQKIKLQPKPGLLVAFPSGHEYLHGAEPTESGVRYCLVSWAAAQGVKKVREKAPYGAIFMKEFRNP